MTNIIEYCCETKISNFIFDNATINKPIIDKLCRALNLDFDSFLFYVHCVWHILYLIVQDGM